MRRAHLLRATKNSEMPHETIFVDTETKPIKLPSGDERHELFFGWAAYIRTRGRDDWTQPQWLHFTTVDMYWQWALSLLHGKSKLYMFAHNWAFDAPVLNTFNVLPSHDYKLTGSVIESPPVILKWRKPPHTIAMIDTLNIWRMPLATLGDSIGLPKLDMPDYDASQDEWDAYAKRDVEIIMQACLAWWDFLKSNDLGSFAPTIASQAIRTYKHKFMRHKILIDDDKKALSLARQSLHGGRTECFYLGSLAETIYKLDINSQYPALMEREQMPTVLNGHYRDVSKCELDEWLKHYCISAKVNLKTDKPAFAIEQDDKLIFPVGDFTAYLSSPELRYALDNDLIIDIECANVYQRAIIFADYIEYFYRLKIEAEQNNDRVKRGLCKLLMNSLYGKFAQRGLVYTKTDTTEDDAIRVWTEYDVDDNTTHHYRQYAHIIEQLQQHTESRDSHPAISAHVTAHARMQMWGLMQVAGQGNYYYCDTDSLWCNKKGYDNLSSYLDETKLGYLKVEGVSDNVIINGVKDYIFDNETRIKGVRAKARVIDNNTFEQDEFTTLKGLLRRGDLSAPVVSKVIKRLSRQYTKGQVMSDGLIVPLSLRLSEVA